MALDFGCGHSNLAFAAALCGYEVIALDQRKIRWQYRMPGLSFVQGDLLAVRLPSAHYDLIINCSTVEHVGLMGRYGSLADPDGDLRSMERLRELAQPEGRMLLTVPVGIDGVFAPRHRVYGEERLPRLLWGWSIEEQAFWHKQKDGLWTEVVRPAALAVRASADWYALGLFTLRVSAGG